MAPYLASHSCWRIGLRVSGGLALLTLAAALFMLVSDDFVIRGQVVPATDARVVVWRICLSLAALLTAALAWLCHRQSHRLYACDH